MALFLSLHLALEFAVCPHRILQIKYVDADAGAGADADADADADVDM